MHDIFLLFPNLLPVFEEDDHHDQYVRHDHPLVPGHPVRLEFPLAKRFHFVAVTGVYKVTYPPPGRGVSSLLRKNIKFGRG